LWQIAAISGPAVGGIAFGALGASNTFLASAALCAAGFVAQLRVRPRAVALEKKGTSWSTVLAGVGYVWRNRARLGSISLDLFAVLLGGATALLPIFAGDVLHVGPWGLGLLRSAPSVGAAVMAIVLAHRPLERNAGKTMLACVAIFGVATI